MSIAIQESTKLALQGGTPVTAPLAPPPWPPIDEITANRLGDLYRSRQWSFNGEREQAICRDFAAYHGAQYGVFMANGTVTLQLALGVLGIGPGDEVIVPALTWLATAAAAIYLGAVPVFVDIDPATLCLDPLKIEAAITPRTRAIIPVHLYGSMADLEAILAIAARHNLVVVEDCAHGHGGIWNGRGVGSWGDIGSFSFQQSKTVACGEGGMCLTNELDTAERLFSAKHIGYPRDAEKVMIAVSPPEGLMCHNFRATEFQAVLLEEQTRNLASRMKTYNLNAQRLEDRLRDTPGVRVQARGRLADVQNYYAFCVAFENGPLDGVPLPRILEALAAEGFAMQRTYGPVYRHQLWNMPDSAYRIAEGGCPIADGLATDRVGLFFHPWLGEHTTTIDQIGDIIDKVARHGDALKSD